MSYKTIIGVKNAGHIVPESVSQELIKNFSSSVCIVLAQDNQLMYQRFEKLTLETWQTLQEEAKDMEVAFAFSSLPAAGHSVESLQPFVLLKNHSDIPIVLGVLSGEFNTITPPKSSHSGEYHASQKLAAKLSKVFNKHTELEKFIGELDGEDFGEYMELLMQPKGIATLITTDGTIMTYSANAEGNEFEWGAISEILDAPPKVVEETPKKKGLLAGLIPAGKPAVQTTIASTAPIPQKPPVAAKAADTAVAEVGIPFEMWTVPANLNSKNLRQALNAGIGCLPYGFQKTYESGGAFPRPKDKSVKFRTQDSYENFRKAAAESKTNTVPAAVVGPFSTKVSSEDSASDLKNVVPTSEKKSFNETFLKKGSVQAAVSYSRELITHPKIVARRDNVASETFASQSGMQQGLYDTLGWDETDLRSFMKDHPNLAFLLTRDLILQTIAYEAAKETSTKQDAPPAKKGLLAGLTKAG